MEKDAPHPNAKKFLTPYRHVNGTLPEVQDICEANAPIMGAAARIVRTHLPEVYDSMWAPIRAAPVSALTSVYPTPAQQQHRAAGRREWDVRDALPAKAAAAAAAAAGGGDAAFPTSHIASRVSGAADNAGTAFRRLVARGVSNLHTDPVDAPRRRGVPIVYVSQVSEAARLHPDYDPRRPLPSSDLVLAEHGCEGGEGPGRFVRVVTCVDGWACIVIAHYERQLHGGVYPVGACGKVVDEAGEPHLAEQLVNGVELLRCVCYGLASVDDFHFAMQTAYDDLATGGDDDDDDDAQSGGGGAAQQPNKEQKELVRELYLAYAPPLDERLRMLHPWLTPKEDSKASEPFGLRSRWLE